MTLSVLAGSQVCGNGVVLNGLVKHEGHETGTICHGCSYIAFLLE